MTILYVTSDVEGAGKTAFATALAKILSDSQKVSLIRLSSSKKLNNDNLNNNANIFESIPIEVINSDEKSAIKSIKAASGKYDVVIIDGYSGLDSESSIKLTNEINPKIILVSQYNPSLKTFELTNQSKHIFGDSLLGLIINKRTKHMANQVINSLVPSIESDGIKVLGVLPEDRRMLGVTVDQLKNRLNGNYAGFLTDDMKNYLIEHFLIGGLILDWGVHYFNTRVNKAVISRGDRPDIQMSALATPTSCLVATSGVTPVEYIIYEAEQEEVPIIVVENSTLSVAKELEYIYSDCKFNHRLKLDRFTELINANIDLTQIL